MKNRQKYWKKLPKRWKYVEKNGIWCGQTENGEQIAWTGYGQPCDEEQHSSKNELENEEGSCRLQKWFTQFKTQG